MRLAAMLVLAALASSAARRHRREPMLRRWQLRRLPARHRYLESRVLAKLAALAALHELAVRADGGLRESIWAQPELRHVDARLRLKERDRHAATS